MSNTIEFAEDLARRASIMQRYPGAYVLQEVTLAGEEIVPSEFRAIQSAILREFTQNTSNPEQLKASYEAIMNGRYVLDCNEDPNCHPNPQCDTDPDCFKVRESDESLRKKFLEGAITKLAKKVRSDIFDSVQNLSLEQLKGLEDKDNLVQFLKEILGKHNSFYYLIEEDGIQFRYGESLTEAQLKEFPHSKISFQEILAKVNEALKTKEEEKKIEETRQCEVEFSPLRGEDLYHQWLSAFNLGGTFRTSAPNLIGSSLELGINGYLFAETCSDYRGNVSDARGVGPVFYLHGIAGYFANPNQEDYQSIPIGLGLGIKGDMIPKKPKFLDNNLGGRIGLQAAWDPARDQVQLGIAGKAYFMFVPLPIPGGISTRFSALLNDQNGSFEGYEFGLFYSLGD